MKARFSNLYDLEALRRRGIFVEIKNLSSYAEKLFGNKDEITIEVVAKLETVLSLVSSGAVQRIVSAQKLDDFHNGESVPDGQTI